MRKRILISLAMVVVLGLSIGLGCIIGQLNPYKSIAFAESPPDSSTSSGIMAVFYVIDDGLYLFWCDSTAQIVDNGDTWDVFSPQVNAIGVNKAVVTYDYYKYKPIEPIYDDEGNKLPQYIADLGLVPPTAGDLSQSGHFARLDDIHPSDVLKAEVSRYWNGQWYTGIRCLVTLQAYQAYGVDLQIGDYVWVYYTNDPRPGHEHEEVPIVIDKVVYP